MNIDRVISHLESVEEFLRYIDTEELIDEVDQLLDDTDFIIRQLRVDKREQLAIALQQKTASQQEDDTSAKQ